MKKVLLLLLSITFLLTSCVKKSLLEDAEAEIEVLENQNLSLEGQVLQLGTQITTLTNSNASLISENANIASDLADVNATLAETNALLADANIDRASLSAQVEGLKEQVATLQYAVDQENVYKINTLIDVLTKDVKDQEDFIATEFAITLAISDPVRLGYTLKTTSNTLTEVLAAKVILEARVEGLRSTTTTQTTATSGNLADAVLDLTLYITDTVNPAQAAYDNAKEAYDTELERLTIILNETKAELAGWITKRDELLDDLVL